MLIVIPIIVPNDFVIDDSMLLIQACMAVLVKYGPQSANKNSLTTGDLLAIITLLLKFAAMAESADALDSGSSRGNSVEVQVLLAAPKT